MSTVTSDNSFIIESEIQDLSDIKEEIISEDIICKTEPVDTEKVLNISFEKRKLSEIISVSSSTSSFDSCSDSDTDNNSDLDEEENNNDQKICDEKLREIESGFELLKTMLYKERIRKVEEKLIEVRLGTAKEYEIPLQTLKDQMDSRLEVASLLRQFKLVNLKHKYEAEEQAIRQNFENNKEILYDTIKADLEEKIQQLEEARNEVDIDASLWLGRSLRCSGRGRGRHPYRQVQPKRKPVIISGGPCIVYMLKEHEILEDWTAIKKMLSSSKRIENADQRYKSY